MEVSPFSSGIAMSPVLLWFLSGVAFFLVELALPGFILFFFGLGAWCTAAVLSLFSCPLSTQLIIFLLTSLVTLILLRSWLRDAFLGSSRLQEDSVNVEPVAATAVVVEDILPPAHGRVKYGGSFWQAEAGEPITVGTTVRVVEQKNLLVKVHPLEKEEL